MNRHGGYTTLDDNGEYSIANGITRPPVQTTTVGFAGLWNHLRGWRGALKLLCVTSWLLLVSNLAISIAVSKGTSVNEPKFIQSGSCEDINMADIWIHLAMNIFSSGLLSATNFAMQTWAAPTRSEIDRMHAARETADIGIPSIYNLVYIKPKRLFLWFFMLLVALPLHLVYNSAVYKTISTSTYNVLLVTPEYFNKSFTISTTKDDGSKAYKAIHGLVSVDRKDSEWEELSIQDIGKRYNSSLADTFRDLVFIAADPDLPSLNNTSTRDGGIIHTFTADGYTAPSQSAWIEERLIPHWLQNITEKQSKGISYTIRDSSWDSALPNETFPILPTALSERFELPCRLMATPLFWWSTAVCNLLIACCLTGMIWLQKSVPLVTVGDVLDSFLSHPSEHVPKTTCTYDHTAYKNIFQQSLLPRPFHGQERRWWNAVGLTRWCLTTLWFSLLLLALLLIFIPISVGRFNDIISNAFGSFDPNSIITSQKNQTMSSALPLVTLANMPQIIMSLTYFFYNAIFTTMLAEHEWHKIGRCRQGNINNNSNNNGYNQDHNLKQNNKNKTHHHLRVSNPRGQQRDTFFLSLPYGYAIPLLIVSTAVQWLASQSVFFTEVDVWSLDGKHLNEPPPTARRRRSQDPSESSGNAFSTGSGISTIGCSRTAIFCLLIIGSLSWITAMVMGWFRRYPAGMPVLGACTAVVAASCHLPEEVRKGRDVAAGPISWGVIRHASVDEDTGQVREEQWLGFVPGDDCGPAVEEPVENEVYG